MLNIEFYLSQVLDITFYGRVHYDLSLFTMLIVQRKVQLIIFSKSYDINYTFRGPARVDGLIYYEILTKHSS